MNSGQWPVVSGQWSVTARWILPADRPPLAHGTITIQGDTIVAVQPAGFRVPHPHGVEDLGDIAILPGFVNAHTHLDLTGMRGQCPPTPDFAAWLRGVIQHRRLRTPEQVQDDIRAGLAECQRHGTTLVGDISGQGLSGPILRDAAIRSVAFLELLGLSAERAGAAYEQAVSWLASRPESGNCRFGLSPHAPYSVRAELFARIARQLAGSEVPCAIHLAESLQELELLEHQRGPTAEFLKELGVWDPTGLSASPAEVVRLFEDVPQTLLIHANYMTAAQVGRAAVVYCPRTHAAFGHAPHPFRDFLGQGVCVALGTDGLASNPDLDILAEARYLHGRYPDLPGEVLLRMLTLNGATALGMQELVGSLTAGKSADLVVLSVDGGDDPYRSIFGATSVPRRVMCRGAWLSLEK